MELKRKEILPTATYADVYVGGLDKAEPPKLYPGRKAIINADYPDQVFSIMTNAYKIQQHDDVIAMAERAIKENPEFGTHTKQVCTLCDGGKMEAKFTFPDTKVDIDGKGDKVSPSLAIRNSYDGGWKFSILLGAFRWFCQNGQFVGKKIYMVKQFHYENLVLDTIQSEMVEALHKFSIQTKIWETWVDRVTTFDEYADVVDTMKLGQKDTEYIKEEVNKPENLVNGKLTLWMLYNIFTYMITHTVKTQQKRIAMEDKARRAFERFN